MVMQYKCSKRDSFFYFCRSNRDHMKRFIASVILFLLLEIIIMEIFFDFLWSNGDHIK